MFSSSSKTMTSTYPLPIAFTYAAGPITLPSSSARAAQFLFPFASPFASYFPASTEKHPVTAKTAFDYFPPKSYIYKTFLGT